MGKNKKRTDASSGIKTGLRDRWLTFFSGVITTLLVGVLTPLVLDGFSITESRLIALGDRPATPTIFSAKVTNGILEAHAKQPVRLKNQGFRSGHVDKVEVVQDGLREFSMNLKVLHVDKTDIGWFEEKEIAFEFVVQVIPFPEKYKNFSLKTYYYGPVGNEIYAETIVLMMTNTSAQESRVITGEVCIRERQSREVKCGEVAIQ